MTSLRQLVLEAYPDHPDAAKLPDISVKGIECDSRHVEPGFLFVAVRGHKQDGNLFIEEAVRRGAAAVVLEGGSAVKASVPFVHVPESRAAAARLAAAFYGQPARHLSVIGITGTNGKTTCSYLIEHLLLKGSKKTGVIGTVSYRYAGKERPAVETTPGPVRLQGLLAEMRAHGCGHVVMEVSSHALDQGRASGIPFTTALFTNLTQDHLDYHKTMEAYFESKAKLFTGLGPGSTAVLNADDPWAMRLRGRLQCRVLTYGIDSDCDLRAQQISPRMSSTEFECHWNGQRRKVYLPLMGRHNIYNALGALGVMQVEGASLEGTVSQLADFPGVPGRLEKVDGGQNFTVLVDFAHTPDGLENVLRSLHDYKQGRLTVVFGCGGDRDKGKRPQMAAIAAHWCDFVYVTSDNPRSEDPKAIAEDVRAGFPAGFDRHVTVLDRHKAIRRALMDARKGDIVLLAGKGHERTQVIGDKAFPFSDRQEAEKVLSGR